MNETTNNSKSCVVPALHGEVGVWVFVLGDMLVFGLFFCVYSYYRGLDPDVDATSQVLLNQHYGALNTVLLLLSSWLVVLAVIDVRERRGVHAPRLVGVAFLCGLGFSVVTFFEYGEKLSAGIGITKNEFSMYYYIFTGIHFIQVLIGMGVFGYLYLMVRDDMRAERDLRVFESGGIFWHKVDLLWIVLFPLLYRLR